MKNFFELLLVVMLGFTACEGPMGQEGPPGNDAVPTEWTVDYFTITSSMWKLAGNPDEIGSYYYCIFDVPGLTKAIYDDGAIISYYRYRDDTGTDVQTVLPYTFYDIYVENNVEHPYSVQYSYDVTPTIGNTPGTIAFKLVFSDFFTGDFGPPASSTFKLTTIY